MKIGYVFKLNFKSQHYTARILSQQILLSTSSTCIPSSDIYTYNQTLLQVQMTQKVKAYFFKNDCYLKADVYNKVPIQFYFCTLHRNQVEAANHSRFTISNEPQQHSVSTSEFYKKIKNSLFRGAKHLFISSTTLKQATPYNKHLHIKQIILSRLQPVTCQLLTPEFRSVQYFKIIFHHWSTCFKDFFLVASFLRETYFPSISKSLDICQIYFLVRL